MAKVNGLFQDKEEQECKAAWHDHIDRIGLVYALSFEEFAADWLADRHPEPATA